MNNVFLGQPPADVKQWIIDHYSHAPQPNDELKLVVQTSGSYMKSGIYLAERDDISKPVEIDWGDGTVEEVNDDISQKVHEYSSEGTFNVIVKNIKTYAASTNNSTWYNTTSQNAYTLKEITAMPDSVKTIGYYAFEGCTSLASVIIPDSVQEIGYGAFFNCTSLASVTIPDGVQTINSYAFSECTALTSVTIPDSVQEIGDNAFYYCTLVTDVYCYPDPADLTWDEYECNDFKSDGSTICHVKAEYLDTYVSKFTGVVNVTFAGDLS